MVDPSKHQAAWMHLLSYIQTVIHHPSATLLWAPHTHSSKEREQPFSEKNSNSEEDEVIDPDYRGATEERLLQPKRPQWSDQRSWSHRSPMMSLWYRDSNSGISLVKVCKSLVNKSVISVFQTSKYISLMLILINSRRTWGYNQKSKDVLESEHY